MKKRILLIGSLWTASLFFLGLDAFAQGALTYQMPPKSIVDLVDAPTTPTVSLTRSGNIALIYERPGFPSIEDVSQPVVGLAGLRLNPKNTASAVESFSTSISVRNLKTGQENKIQGLPANARIANTSMNDAETKLAFTNSTDAGIELWVADLTTFQAQKITNRFVNGAYGSVLTWVPNAEQLLVKFIPENRGQMPVENQVPAGPIVQENLGKAAPARTYQNLLKTPYDEQLFDYFVMSQLGVIDLNGTVKNIGKPGIYRSINYSPDGKYLMVQTVKGPYSYLVPVQSFGYDVAIWDANGNSVKTLHTYALSEAANLNRDAVSVEPRQFGWRPDQAASVYYLQTPKMAEDAEDAKYTENPSDVVYELSAPFQSAPVKLLETEHRFGGINFTDSDVVLVTERSRKDRKEIIYMYNINKKEKLQVVSERSTTDQYTNPGRFVTTQNKYNRGILLTDGKARQLTVFTTSNGPTKEGDFPFLLKWNLVSGKKDTLFKSQAPYYESPVFFDNQGSLIITRESTTEAPNYYTVNLRNRKMDKITDFPDPYPSLKNISKEVVTYYRSDGLKLQGTLYLPEGYTKDQGPLPMILWAYPREFDDLEAASVISGSPYRFTRLSWGSAVYWATRGYAILDNADMPIVGSEGKEPNDTFIEQLEDNSRAAINYLAEQGIVDPKRVAVGGHSYGAFMTANLLAHTDLFAAGLARSGAYNRTFTPFGFQNERRTYWEAQEVYTRMSPFTYAHQIKTPLLLIHGMDDENSGTFPIQSERLYNAIKGHGGTTRLVFLPKEFHGYRAKESIMHSLWEMDQWLEKYVKNKKD